MSKSITGKSIDINLNITQAGTFNAGIFNATEDFTLNGVSIVDRITDLEEDKQDVLTIQQTITPSTTAVASSTAIIDYVASATPTINATAPINYVGNTISATFDTAPTNGSINFLNSDKIFDALALKQNNLTIQQTITSSTTAVASSNAIINYVALATAISGLAPIVNNSGVISATFDNAPTNGSINFLNSDKIYDALALKQDLITSATDITLNNLTSTTGTFSAPTILQSGTNLLQAIVANTSLIGTKQDILTIQQNITPSAVAVASATAIIDYVSTAVSNITATSPFTYISNTISALFDLAPISGSTRLLNSDRIFQALSSKQNLITSATNLTCNNLTNSVISCSGNITSTGGNIACITGNLSTATGSVIAPNIVQSGVNLLNAINNLTTEVDTKQDILTSFSNITTGSIDINGDIQINNNSISNETGTIQINGLTGFISATSISGQIVGSTGGIVANNDIISNSGSVIAPTITGDIYNNLVAGQGVVLQQNTPTIGKTTIIASQLATSTQYVFQATGNQGDVTYSAGNIVNFNTIQISTPNITDYNTTNRRYNVQVAGYYYYGFKLFMNSGITTQGRFGLYKNGSLIGHGGAYLGSSETMDAVVYCNVGDYLDVRVVVGSGLIVFMGAAHSWFYGYLLQPENNTITSSTNLTIGSLNTAGINGNIATITDLTAEDLIVNSNLSSLTGTITNLSTDDLTADNLIVAVNLTSPSATITNLTSTTITGDIYNNLVAGTGILLEQNTPTIGRTTITSTGGAVPNFMFVSLSTNINMGGTTYLLNPNSITSNCLNAGLTYSAGVVGIQQSGYYRISGQMDYFNGITLRACGELAGLINNIELTTYPRGYSYARSGEGRHSSSGFHDWIIFLNNSDNVRFSFSVALGTSSVFNGSLSSFTQLAGSYLSITKL